MLKRLLPVLASACLISACSTGSDKDAAEKGVASFHEAMNAGQFASIYDSSSGAMKSAISRDDFVKLLTGLHTKLGSLKSSTMADWRVNFGTSGHVAVIHMNAQFERGPGSEEFVFTLRDGKAQLAGYHVTSNLLVID